MRPKTEHQDRPVFDFCSANGFGLIGVLLMLLGVSLAAGTIFLRVGSLYDDAFHQETKNTLERLALSIANDPSPTMMGVRQYEADVGALPSTLNDLMTKPGGVPPCSMNSVTQRLEGWCGPYWSTFVEGQGPFLDSWGKTVLYDKADRKLKSTGRNQTDDGGAGDDLVQKF